MFDASDLLEFPRALLLGVLRALWWLAYDFLIQTIGWSVGWLTLRLLSFGKLPKEPLSALDQVSFGLALFIELIGLITLACLILLLSGNWPRL